MTVTLTMSSMTPKRVVVENLVRKVSEMKPPSKVRRKDVAMKFVSMLADLPRE